MAPRVLGRPAGGCLARTQGGCNGGALALTEDVARRRLLPSRCVGMRRRDHWLSSWNTISEVPIVMVSPSRSDCGRAGSTLRPLTFTPLFEPRSQIVHEAPDGRTWACLRDTLGSSTFTSSSRELPSTAPPEPITLVRPLTRRRSPRRRGSGSASCPEIRLEGEYTLVWPWSPWLGGSG